MEDNQIVELYWRRDEEAIQRTSEKYGRYCTKIAFSILNNSQDSDECVNDTYMQTWDSIPDNRPEKLRTYIGKICRNLAINLYEKVHAAKRGGSMFEDCLDELADIAGGQEPETELEAKELTDSINGFLGSLSYENRVIFVKRYWQIESVKEIATDLKISESKVKMVLLRTREKLKDHLLKEGYSL